MINLLPQMKKTKSWGRNVLSYKTIWQRHKPNVMQQWLNWRECQQHSRRRWTMRKSFTWRFHIDFLLSSHTLIHYSFILLFQCLFLSFTIFLYIFLSLYVCIPFLFIKEKTQVEELTQQVNSLTETNSALSAQLSHLTEQNAQLTEELKHHETEKRIFNQTQTHLERTSVTRVCSSTHNVILLLHPHSFHSHSPHFFFFFSPHSHHASTQLFSLLISNMLVLLLNWKPESKVNGQLYAHNSPLFFFIPTSFPYHFISFIFISFTFFFPSYLFTVRTSRLQLQRRLLKFTSANRLKS